MSTTITGGSPFTSTIPLVDPYAPPSQVAPETAPPDEAPYFGLPFARVSVDTLGLSLPNSPEDAEALLAAVSLALDKTVSETNSNRAQVVGEKLRAALNSVGNILAQMTDLAAHIAEVEQKKSDAEQSKTEKTSQRDTKVTDSGTLQTKIDTDDGEISTANQQINDLNTQIADKQTNGDTAGANALISQRDSVAQSRDSIVVQRTGFASDKQKLDDDVKTLNGDIQKLDDDIKADDTDISTSQAEYSALQVTMFTVFVALTLAAEGLDAGDKFKVATRDTQIVRAFENVAFNVEDFDNLIQTRSDTEVNLEQLRERGDDARSRVIDAAIGLVGGLLDLLKTLSALEPPPTVNTSEAALENGSRLRLPV